MRPSIPPVVRDMCRFAIAAIIVGAVAAGVGALFGWLLTCLRNLPHDLIWILAAVLGGCVGGSYWIMAVSRGMMIRYDARRRDRQTR